MTEQPAVPLTGKLSVQIEQFPAHPIGRQTCFVWTKKDGSRVIFGCDTQENCQQTLAHWQQRARIAEQNGWETL